MQDITTVSGPELINRYCSGPGFSTCMSARPEFYSNRGVSEGDLGESHLTHIHQCLERDFGPQVAQQFCLMVENITDLSATNFLNQFYAFVARGGTDAGLPRSESGIDVGPDGPGREAVAFATIANALGRKAKPAEDAAVSAGIKSRFFRKVHYVPAMPMPETDYAFSRYGR